MLRAHEHACLPGGVPWKLEIGAVGVVIPRAACDLHHRLDKHGLGYAFADDNSPSSSLNSDI